MSDRLITAKAALCGRELRRVEDAAVLVRDGKLPRWERRLSCGRNIPRRRCWTWASGC